MCMSGWQASNGEHARADMSRADMCAASPVCSIPRGTSNVSLKSTILVLWCRWEAEVGWKVLRWQSNVWREASFTVTMGAAAAAVPVGPRGGEEPVVQFTYEYGCQPFVPQQAPGMVALVVAKGERDAGELMDPTGNIVRIE